MNFKNITNTKLLELLGKAAKTHTFVRENDMMTCDELIEKYDGFLQSGQAGELILWDPIVIHEKDDLFRYVELIITGRESPLANIGWLKINEVVYPELDSKYNPPLNMAPLKDGVAIFKCIDLEMKDTAIKLLGEDGYNFACIELEYEPKEEGQLPPGLIQALLQRRD
jgi:hypothetical protein